MLDVRCSFCYLSPLPFASVPSASVPSVFFQLLLLDLVVLIFILFKHVLFVQTLISKQKFTIESLTLSSRWVMCDNHKKMAEFEKENIANMARDAEGSLSFLTTSEWQLDYCMKEWPEIEFFKTREIN